MALERNVRPNHKKVHMNLRVHWAIALAALSVIGAGTVTAQTSLVPESAQAVMYFPHLTEGGPDANNSWQATFTFVNTNQIAANLSVSFYNDDGTPMMLDFGSGAVATLSAVVPANGSRMFRSQLTHKGPAPVWGWAAGHSDVPVMGQLTYRSMTNGAVSAELAANSTTGTAQWTSAANANMGIAVANPSPTDTMTYKVDVVDASGNDLGAQSFQLVPHGHDAFSLATRFKSLPANFSGSVSITGQTATPSVYKPTVWTVGWEVGSFATLPDGRSLVPADQTARAMRVWGRIMAMTKQLGYMVNPSFMLMPGSAANGIANATGGLDASGNQQVTMYMSLVEMVGDSDGELAFLTGHEMAHVIQCRTNGCKVPVDSQMMNDPESDADEIAMMLTTSAGYDSYSGAGAYARLQLGNGQAAMGMMGGGTTVWEDMMSTNPQGLFAARINMMYQVQQRMCANPMFSTNCQAYKNIMHPSTGGMNMHM
jgi:hypothetical protein